MAKKKAPKKKAPLKIVKKKAPAKKKSAAVKRPPADRSLPGMENIGKDRILDGHCRRLSEIRASAAELRADDAGESQGALNRMRALKWNHYRQHGIELARVPGEEKLRVKLTSKGASAEVEEAEEAPDYDGEPAEFGPGSEEDGPEQGIE